MTCSKCFIYYNWVKKNVLKILKIISFFFFRFDQKRIIWDQSINLNHNVLFYVILSRPAFILTIRNSTPCHGVGAGFWTHRVWSRKWRRCPCEILVEWSLLAYTGYYVPPLIMTWDKTLRETSDTVPAPQPQQ